MVLRYNDDCECECVPVYTPCVCHKLTLNSLRLDIDLPWFQSSHWANAWRYQKYIHFTSSQSSKPMIIANYRDTLLNCSAINHTKEKLISNIIYDINWEYFSHQISSVWMEAKGKISREWSFAVKNCGVSWIETHISYDFHSI